MLQLHGQIIGNITEYVTQGFLLLLRLVNPCVQTRRKEKLLQIVQMAEIHEIFMLPNDQIVCSEPEGN